MSERYVPRNVSAEIVALYLDDIIKTSNMCKCERCRADVYAIVLNAMPPQYVVTDEGDLLVRAMALSNQYRVDILTAITRGVMLVEKGPRHSEEDLARLAEREKQSD